jgi:hypothetical protein
VSHRPAKTGRIERPVTSERLAIRYRDTPGRGVRFPL